VLFWRKFSRVFDAIKLIFFARLKLIYVRRTRELHNDTGSEASQESGIFSTGSSQESPRKEAAAGAARRPGAGQADRRPGLGRRAITQINLKERKNSYNSALARSQENLVQVRPKLVLCSFNICLKYRCRTLLLWILIRSDTEPNPDFWNNIYSGIFLPKIVQSRCWLHTNCLRKALVAALLG
jgi:hypothetical protein